MTAKGWVVTLEFRRCFPASRSPNRPHWLFKYNKVYLLAVFTLSPDFSRSLVEKVRVEKNRISADLALPQQIREPQFGNVKSQKLNLHPVVFEPSKGG
jgi:hypothetical protein